MAGKTGPAGRRSVSLIASLAWQVARCAASVLAIGALLIALGTIAQNDLVRLILDIADKVDLAVYSRQNGIFNFIGQAAEDKNAPANWGPGAIVWLVLAEGPHTGR